MIIRRAVDKDAQDIGRLLSQVLEVHHEGRPDLFKTGARKYTSPELSGIISDENRPIFVAECDGVVSGYAFCIIKQEINDNILTDIKTLYIDDLCVDSAVRGRGIGKALYEYVKNYAKACGCYNLTLNVWACNESAMRFYKKCGLSVQKTGMEEIL